MLRPLRPTLPVLLIVALAFPLAAFGQHPPSLDKIRKREVAEVRFVGDSSISELELSSVVSTHPSDGFGRFINGVFSGLGTPRQFIEEGTLDEDTIRLFVYYRNKGFFDAKIHYTLTESKSSVEAWQKVNEHNKFLPPTKWDPYPFIQDTVVFHVSEGTQYRIVGFTFEGLEHLPMNLQNEVTQKIGIKPRSYFSKDALELEIARVRATLGENGYPFLSLSSGLTIVERDTALKTLTISLKFKTGPRVRLGEAKIVYDTTVERYGQVRESVVRRQLSMEPGAWYKNSVKLASERDVQRLLTFQSVAIELDTSIYANIPDSARDGIAVPVLVGLRMRPSWELTPGPFAGSSAQSEFIFGLGVAYSNRNLFDGAENLTLQASYQFFPKSEKRATVSGQLIFPYFFFRNVPLILSPNYSYASDAGKYLEEILSASAGSKFDVSNDPALRITLSPQASLQKVRREYTDQTLRPHDTTFTLQPQFNTIVSNDFIVDWRNDIQNPSHGSSVRYSLEWAVPLLSIKGYPSAAYVKNTLEFKTFANLVSTEERSVIAYRITGGLVSLTYPGDLNRDILFENRYYGGGTSSLRGWAARSLLVSNNTNPGWPSLGGYKTFETNVEWRLAPFRYPLAITGMQQLLSPVRFALFCDVGNVWDKDVPISAKDFAITLGAGFHYITVLGAIRLDFGFKLYDPYPNPYPPGTKRSDESRDNVLAIPPNTSSGIWLFNRRNEKLGDVMNIELALGQAF